MVPIDAQDTTPGPAAARHLNPEQLALLRRRLELEKRRLLAEYALGVELERDARLEDPGDTIDEAEATGEREDLFALTESEREALRLVEEALDRMDEGSFGFCLVSGEPIPYSRLEALPWARYTARVQGLIEDGVVDERDPSTWTAATARRR
jgi:DnaK suppressor protein